MNFLFPLILAAAPLIAPQTAPLTPVSDVQTAVDVEVYACNFELANDTNYDHWPDNWTRRRGTGYPQYLKVAITPPTDQEATGNHFLRLELNGGAIQVSSPPIPFNSKFDYVFTGRLRTEGLEHNIAYASVTLYDAEHNIVNSFKLPPVKRANDWQPFKIGPFTSDNDLAVRAVLSLHLRPTDQSDLNGAAMFDDLRLLKVPQLKITTNHPFKVLVKGEPIQITATISNVQERPVPVEFTLFDPQGNKLASDRQTDMESFTWEPQIPNEGFYRVHVLMHVTDELKLERDVDLAVIEKQKLSPRGEFGWSLPRGSHSLPIRSLPELLSRSAVNWIKLPLWKEVDAPEQVLQLSWLAEHLRFNGIQMIGVLDEPPQEYRKQFRQLDTLPIGEIFADPTVWPGALDAVLSRLSLHVHWWQLGRDQDATFLALPQSERQFRDVQKHVRQYGTNMRLGLAWPWLDELPKQHAAPWDFVSRAADPPLTEAELIQYSAASGQPGPRRWVMLEPLARHEYDRATRARDLVARMLAAKIGRAEGIFIANPFDPERGLMTPTGSPTELFLPWRTTALMVSGSQHLGSLQLPNGSRNQVFARGDELVLVAWNDQPTTERLYLGENIRITDVWGHPQTPTQHPDDSRPEHEIAVGPLPIFVTGIDPFVARWRINFHLLTSRLQIAPGRSQTLAVDCTNPSDQSVEGTLRMQVADTWRLNERQSRLSLNPNQQERSSLQVQLGSEATTGPYRVRFDFDLFTNRSHRFSAYETVQVGLGEVDLQMSSRLDDNGDLIVEQQLLNYTDTPVNFLCELFIPNRGRERKTIRNLGQGQATNTFVIPRGQELIGQTLWLRANETNGDRKLSHELIVEP